MIIKIKRMCCGRNTEGSTNTCPHCFGKGYIEEVIEVINFTILEEEIK